MTQIIRHFPGINLSRAQLAINFLDRSIPRNLRQVLAQLSAFRAAYVRAQTVKPNGFTIDALGNVTDYASGYAVATSSYTDIDDLIRNNQNVIACGNKSALHFGYWRDSQTGIQYFDSVDVVSTLDRALELAWQRSELAVYSFANNKDIRLADYDRIQAAFPSRAVMFVPKRVVNE